MHYLEHPCDSFSLIVDDVASVPDLAEVHQVVVDDRNLRVKLQSTLYALPHPFWETVVAKDGQQRSLRNQCVYWGPLQEQEPEVVCACFVHGGGACFCLFPFGIKAIFVSFLRMESN